MPETGSRKFCPHCSIGIDHLRYLQDYTEWGTESGTADFNGDVIEWGDRDCNDSQTENLHTLCPNCDERLDPSDVLDELPGEEEEEKEEEVKLSPAACDTSPNPTGPLVEKVRAYGIAFVRCPVCHLEREFCGSDDPMMECQCGNEFHISGNTRIV